MSADANLPHDVGVAFEAERPVDQRRRGARARKIHEHARGILDALFAERHLGVELDRDAYGVGQDGAADLLDRRETGGADTRVGSHNGRGT